MKPILTILEPHHFSEAALVRLEEHFDLKPLTCEMGSRFNIKGFLGCEVLWTRLRSIDKLEAFANVRLIACNCTDVSHLPLEECTRRGIDVLSLKGIEGLDNVHATAEHTISLMLQALRHRADRSSGRIGRELYGKKVLIFGCGRIGTQVKQLLHSFGAATYSWQVERREWWQHQAFTSDIVSIHASLNETSRGMVNAEFLSKLKPGCILVNTARDAIVDRKAVLNWLYRDEAAIYAHDFAEEWNLASSKEEAASWPECRGQVIATPHIGGWTIESLHKTEELLAEKVIEWAKKARMEVSA